MAFGWKFTEDVVKEFVDFVIQRGGGVQRALPLGEDRWEFEIIPPYKVEEGDSWSKQIMQEFIQYKSRDVFLTP